MESLSPPSSSPKAIAIIGGGISGISCSWELREQHCTVDLYESDDRLGGHANSVPFQGNGRSVNVDTGFIVMDKSTYPQFSQFLQQLDVGLIPTDMSFGVSAGNGAFEWGSYSISSFVDKLSHLASPWFWRFAFDIVRFNLFAQDYLHEIDSSEPHGKGLAGTKEDAQDHRQESIGDYLVRNRYSSQFIDYFLIPMAAAPWCIDPDEFARTFPARSLIEFMLNHSLLETTTKTLRWHSFQNGSKTYVDAFHKALPRNLRLHLGTPIQSVSRSSTGVVLELANGQCKQYDHVILAIHANQALSLLGDNATAAERSILGSFKTSRNVCYLHSDTSLLPKRSAARVAWNCFLDSANPAMTHATVEKCFQEKPANRISITFDMNKIQGIPFPGQAGSPGRVLVSMNPSRVPCSLQSSQVYYHPLITTESMGAIPHLHDINGVAGVSFAGAWMGFGFHEDGFAAGVHAARTVTNKHENMVPLDLIGYCDERKPKVRNMGAFEWILRMAVIVVHWLLLMLTGELFR